MSAPRIGRTVRRLRQEQNLTQQALAVRLGISASYLNLIEHEQRAVTASLLIKLGEALRVDLAALSGSAERQLEAGLREAFADPLLGAEPVPDLDLATIAASSPAAARAVLALYRAWRVTREDASGISLPSGRRLLLPTEEARDAFHERSNHFPSLEEASDAMGAALNAAPADMGHAIAQRLHSAHGLTVRVGQLDGAQSRHDPAARMIWLSETLAAESRAFHLAFQLSFLEARDAVEAIIEALAPSTTEAAALIRIGLLNYAAGALLMPYGPFRREALVLRHDVERLAGRFAVSFEQACHRLSTLQRPNRGGVANRGIPFFFLRVDPAGNVSKRFSAAGFPFARYGGSCSRWVVHAAFATPGTMRVQVARLPDGATFLCFARTVSGPPVPWGEPQPVHVVAMGCDIAHAGDICYADGIDLDAAPVGIGLSCRLCDRQNCRSRAFPPLEHRLALDPLTSPDTPYKFTKQ